MKNIRVEATARKRKPGPGRPRTYLDGHGTGAPVLRVRLAPDVHDALRATDDPRATIERLVREHLTPADAPPDDLAAD